MQLNLARLNPFARKSAGSSRDLLRLMFGGSKTKSGQAVTVDTALRVAAVFACVRVIAEGIAQVPCKVFQESEDGRTRLPAKKHPLYRLLHRKPNPWMSSFEMRETMAIHAVMCGRAYAFVNRVMGKVVEIIPLKPENCTTRVNDDWSRTYLVRGKDGTQRAFPADSIWHWKGPSWDGEEGMDVVRLAREAIGLSLATEEAHAKLHSNGVSPAGVYSVSSTTMPARIAACQ